MSFRRCGLVSCFAGSRGGRDVDSGEDAENVSLHHAGKETEQVHEAGKKRGVIVSKMATIIVPLMMLPNRRMASANVRESSLMTFNGNMIHVGFR